jgi:hypothetical protein
MVRSLFVPSYSRIYIFLVATACLLMVPGSSGAQTQRRAAGPAAAAQDESPLFHEYRGVQLGMIADEVRKKLGEPREKGAGGDFFVFNETETAQIVYDKTLKVVTISADFFNPTPNALTAKQVFGADITAKADGSVYKMVRYPKAGYSLTYARTSGDAPMTSVTLQKIP